MSSYPYFSLPPDGDNIRLLRLLPNRDKAAPIQCELCNYSLQKSGLRTHVYEALSYVWGNPRETLPIWVDKNLFPVTVNLRAALSCLRDHSFERIIWVDSICIDQGNKRERGQQVQLMAKIYSKASRVLVWLGETAANSDKALLEIVRIATENEYLCTINDRAIQQAILALFKRPWFQRIWVLQEVAAARHILVMCGSTEIDGYAFCLGVSRFYEAYPDIENSIHSITYLMKGAIFRPKHISSLGKSSLDIRPLGELVDMFHSHNATQLVDKVYALLGMSSDDPSTAGLLPNYEVEWEELFKDLIKFVLSKQVYVKTWSKEESAIIKSKGCVLGQVVSIESSDGNKVNIVFKNMPEHLGCQSQWQTLWTLQASAKHVREGDIVCLLQGAQMPIIVRLCYDYFTVIRITVALAGKLTDSGGIEWSKLLRSMIVFPRDFLLIWTWEDSPGELQEPQKYETLLQMNNWVSAYSEIGHLDKARRIWNVAMILDDLEEYDKAEERLQEAIEGYEIAFGQEHLCTPNGQYGRTPLSWAAGNGYDAVVNVLLRKDNINSNSKDSQSGRAPLSWAAQNGHEAVVKILLVTSEIDVDSKDRDGRTALWWAAQSGHEAVVKLLLMTGEIEVDPKDRDGRTPLWWAAVNGHEAVVSLLLVTGEVEVDPKDRDGRTPLWWAAQIGHKAVVKQLLANSKVEVDPKDTDGLTPLWWAVENGHEAVVELLLATSKVKVDSKDFFGRMLLSIAAKNGHEAVVKLLLATGKAEVNSKDNIDRTALWWAAQSGHEAVVKLLLVTSEVEVDPKDRDGRTPLAVAAENGHEAVVKLLLATRKVEVDLKNFRDSTLLSLAACNGHESVVKLLLATNKVKINSKDVYNLTPLEQAVENGHGAVVKLLLATNKVKVDLKDHFGRTLLFRAAGNGHEAIVKLLLATGKVEVNSKDEYDETPISRAALHGHEAVVKLLRKHIN